MRRYTRLNVAAPASRYRPVTLPIDHKIRAGGLAERQGGDAADLIAVGHTAVVLEIIHGS